MLILFAALIFGFVVFFILLKGMGRDFREKLRGTGKDKVRAIIRLVLFIEVIIYILVFLAVTVKTIFM